ncbi:UNKNOWN [Stylonychia lemnae]|uniref:Transmembrane protein n=1 Tax=Stylonychia lemnae TaxID=5949 RepID=A0A078B9U8_STYLE|nr:UNKNOWN [Stylonychia lemnae]|eukprot:CDW91199.1 UNKNOWN [Stylonychia lemnae]
MSDSDEQDLRVHLLDSDDQHPDEEFKSEVVQEERSKTVMNAGKVILGKDNSDQRFEMQDLAVRHMSPTTIFKKSQTIRPLSVGGSGGNQPDSDGNRGVTLNSKNTLVGSGNQPKSRGSQINNLLTQRGILPTQQRAQSEGKLSNDSAYIRKQKRRIACRIVCFNLLEPILIGLLLLNSVFYPNFGSALYFVFALFLTGLCLTKDEKKIKLKQFTSIAILFIAFAIIITKIVFLVELRNMGELKLDSEDVLLYETSGIYIQQSTTKIRVVNVVISVLFDIIELILCILITVLYGSQRKDLREGLKADGTGQFLLNQHFEKHQETICILALISIALDSIMVQTVFQLFIISNPFIFILNHNFSPFIDNDDCLGSRQI